MKTKTRNTLLISLIVFIVAVITISFLLADKLPSSDEVYEANGGYLFTFDVECIDTHGNLLKRETMTGNGTNLSFLPPAIEGYTTTCRSITRNDITDWSFPPSNYDREATGSYILVYTPVN